MRTILIVAFAAVVLQSACAVPVVPAYAREAKKRPEESGVIALHLNATQDDRALASNLMKSNCGDRKVKVLEEQEVAIGERSEGLTGKQTEKAGFFEKMLGGKDEDKMKSTTEKVALKEWQIIYECV